MAQSIDVGTRWHLMYILSSCLFVYVRMWVSDIILGLHYLVCWPILNCVHCELLWILIGVGWVPIFVGHRHGQLGLGILCFTLLPNEFLFNKQYAL